nr:agamous-like MADS-box protein AP1 [Populus alba]
MEEIGMISFGILERPICEVEDDKITIWSPGFRKKIGFARCTAENSSLRNILERYDTHKTKSQEIAICKNVDKTKQNHHAEYMGPSYMDANPLQMVQRYFEGKNIEQLNITQLIQLERELDSTLVYTRGRKTEAMMKSVTALHQKEQDLTDENNLIEREISAIINNGNLAGQHGRVVEDPDCVHPSPLDLFHF